MPEVSRFDGIVIKMFFRKKEHNPPHFHAVYGEYVAEFDIGTGQMIVGDFPKNALSLVEKWAQIHKDELMQIWESQKFDKINPL